MRILHVNDVSSVGSLLVRASQQRDALYQPTLRRRLSGRLKTGKLILGRGGDWRRIRRLWQSGDFTHLHVHYGSLAPLAAGLPFSLHLHGSDLLRDFPIGLKGILTRWAIRNARVVAVSTPNLLAFTGRVRPDAVYVPNPMELPILPATRPPHAQPEIMLLSKMDPNKGWPRQIHIVRSLREQLPGLRFTFIADGHLPAAERDSMARELVALGGRPLPAMAREEYLTLVAGADFAIGQLEVGALGMSEMEAMAAGIPTVVDAREHFKLGFEPVVVEPSEASRTISDLWNSAKRRHDFSLRARAYVATTHDPGLSLKRLEDLLAPPTQNRAT